MASVIIIFVCLFAPLGILWLTYRFPFLNKIGSVFLAYAVGCILGLTGLIPNTPEVRSVQTSILNYSIPFAIPLLLFSSNIMSWVTLAPSFIKSTVFGILGCCIAVTVGFLICGGNDLEKFAAIGGMLTGLFTGGNANLASIKMALGVDETVYVVTSAYSTVLSGLYVVFVIFCGKWVLRLVLPAFPREKVDGGDSGASVENYDSQLFYGLFRRDNLRNLIQSLLLTAAIVALGAGIAFLFPKDLFQTIFILGISTLAIIASCFKRVREMKRTFEAGTYIILVFSIAVASMVNGGTLANIDTNIFLFMTIVTVGAIFMHVLLSAIFRVDSDTTMACGVSLICSPPFVPVVAGLLKNKAIVGPGIAVGLFGYAVGTYIGFLMAKFLLVL